MSAIFRWYFSDLGIFQCYRTNFPFFLKPVTFWFQYFGKLVKRQKERSTVQQYMNDFPDKVSPEQVTCILDHDYGFSGFELNRIYIMGTKYQLINTCIDHAQCRNLFN